MSRRRAATLPHQLDRSTQAIVEAHLQRDREDAARHDPDRHVLLKTADGEEDLDIANASNQEYMHGLGRVPRGMVVVWSTAAITAPLYVSAADKQSITIENPGSVDFSGRIEVW